MVRRFLALTLLVLTFAIASDAHDARTAPPDRVDVIIAFTRPPGPAEEAFVRGLGGTVRGTYTIVPAMAASVPPSALQALARNPLVASVERDGEVEAFDLADADTTEIAAAWGVDRLDANLVWPTANGSGVGVAVVDTGSGPHKDLPAATERWNCLSGTCLAGGNDDNSHGTHVAGTALAVQNGMGVAGVAPEASLFSYKVLDKNGKGNWSAIIAALDHIAINNPARATKVRVANFSLGSGSDPGSTVRAAFDRAYYDFNVLLIGAAGNAFIFACTSVSYPARYDSVVAVGSTDKNDGKSSFSCSGPQLELAAPGRDIKSTVLKDGYGTKSGTSMATPHVTGAAALVLGGPASLADTNADGSVSAQEARDRLNATTKDLGTSGRDSYFGFGLVNPQLAVTGANSHSPY